MTARRFIIVTLGALVFACGGSTVPIDTCTTVDTDPHNCGVCGHDCLGGACVAGVCQAQPTFTSSTDVPSAIAVDATYAFFMTRQFSTQTLNAPITLYRCNKTSCPSTLTTMLTGRTGLGLGLATDGSNVYFADWNNILSCPVTGCGAQPAVLAANQTAPAKIALGQGRVYWADYDGFSGSVMSCPVTGCSAPTVIASNQTNAWGIATDATNVYWTNDVTQAQYSGVYACPLAGCVGAPTAIATNLVNPSTVVSDGSNVYWTDSFEPDMSAYFCPIAGCAGSPKVLSPSLTPSTGIAVDAHYVYAAGSDGGQPSLVRCSKDGCAMGATVLASSQPSLGAIAVDDVAVYWTTWDDTKGGTVAVLAK